MKTSVTKWMMLVSSLCLASVAAACSGCHSGSSAGDGTGTDVPEGGTPAGGACTQPSTCQGYGDPCYEKVTCDEGKCAFKLQNYGFPVPGMQAKGDCVYLACDGFGQVKAIPDDLDRPDAGPCQIAYCVEGVKHAPQAVTDGTSCGDAGQVCTAGACGAPVRDH